MRRKRLRYRSHRHHLLPWVPTQVYRWKTAHLRRQTARGRMLVLKLRPPSRLPSRGSAVRARKTLLPPLLRPRRSCQPRAHRLALANPEPRARSLPRILLLRMLLPIPPRTFHPNHNAGGPELRERKPPSRSGARGSRRSRCLGRSRLQRTWQVARRRRSRKTSTMRTRSSTKRIWIVTEVSRIGKPCPSALGQ